MSTRGAIGRLTSKPGEPITFESVYHHWDSYPSGLGKTLFKLYKGHFKRDLNAMLKYLIDDHKKGWSTINGADFNLPAAPRANEKLQICKVCGKPNWMHYAQYYTDDNKEWVKAGKPPCPPRIGTSYAVMDHGFIAVEVPYGPVCFEDGDENLITDKDASSCGCEFVYAFTVDGRMLVLSSYCKSGAKMIGYFGCGDPNAEWKVIGEIQLDGKEPNWKKEPIVQTYPKKKAKNVQAVKSKTAKDIEDFKKSKNYELVG